MGTEKKKKKGSGYREEDRDWSDTKDIWEEDKPRCCPGSRQMKEKEAPGTTPRFQAQEKAFTETQDVLKRFLFGNVKFKVPLGHLNGGVQHVVGHIYSVE